TAASTSIRSTMTIPRTSARTITRNSRIRRRPDFCAAKTRNVGKTRTKRKTRTLTRWARADAGTTSSAAVFGFRVARSLDAFGSLVGATVRCPSNRARSGLSRRDAAFRLRLEYGPGADAAALPDGDRHRAGAPRPLALRYHAPRLRLRRAGAGRDGAR